MIYPNRYLLGYPIQKLPFPRGLKKILADAGISSLHQLLKTPYCSWENKVPGLTGRHHRTIVAFLLKTDLYDFLKLR